MRMRKTRFSFILSLILLLLCTFSIAYSNTAMAQSTSADNEIRIRLSFADKEAIALLTDNPTTQSLLKQLPATVTFNDFAHAEKITYLPEKLSTENNLKGHDPTQGDIACYAPWGNLAIYYHDQPYAKELLYMGHFESGIDILASMSGFFEVTIEQLN